MASRQHTQTTSHRILYQQLGIQSQEQTMQRFSLCWFQSHSRNTTNSRRKEPTADSQLTLRQSQNKPMAGSQNGVAPTYSNDIAQDTIPAAGYPVTRTNNATLLSLLVPVATSKRSVATNSNDIAPLTSSNLIAALANYQEQATVTKITRSWTPSRNNETTTFPLQAKGMLTRVDICFC
ncbi:receptor-like protein kinase [Dorcoceras hygrometricum]|uniref:Receptor-like protein kinase n=1 Tax=Dorcoceras hygrometricum TaxID=472368 RepID=A0A2Z7B9A3_9LAMI|nr:receptor-like protein kinase [Dorcoceras hygrometricum]